MKTIQDKLKDLLEKLKEINRMEEKIKNTNIECFALKEDIFDNMFEEGIDKITVDGIEFAPINEIDFSLSKENKGKQWDYFPAWFKWLEEIGEKGLIKTKETVHPGTRKKFLKEWIEEGKKLPNFIEKKLFSTIKYNKSMIKRMALDE